MRPTPIASLALVVAVFACAGCRQAAREPRRGPVIGVVDIPIAGAIVRPGPTALGGWACDETGVREVRLYFDDTFKARTTLMTPRPDVSKSVPRCAKPGDIHGWNFRIDFGMAAGSHSIRVDAVAGDGTVRTIGVVPVTVPY